MSQPLAAVVTIAVLSGVVGGLLSRALWPPRHIPRPHDDGTSQTITANVTFVLSNWAFIGGRVTLAFYVDGQVVCEADMMAMVTDK